MKLIKLVILLVIVVSIHGYSQNVAKLIMEDKYDYAILKLDQGANPEKKAGMPAKTGLWHVFDRYDDCRTVECRKDNVEMARALLEHGAIFHSGTCHNLSNYLNNTDKEMAAVILDYSNYYNRSYWDKLVRYCRVNNKEAITMPLLFERGYVMTRAQLNERINQLVEKQGYKYDIEVIRVYLDYGKQEHKQVNFSKFMQMAILQSSRNSKELQSLFFEYGAKITSQMFFEVSEAGYNNVEVFQTEFENEESELGILFNHSRKTALSIEATESDCAYFVQYYSKYAQSLFPEDLVRIKTKLVVFRISDITESSSEEEVLQGIKEYWDYPDAIARLGSLLKNHELIIITKENYDRNLVIPWRQIFGIAYLEGEYVESSDTKYVLCVNWNDLAQRAPGYSKGFMIGEKRFFALNEPLRFNAEWFLFGDIKFRGNGFVEALGLVPAVGAVIIKRR